MSLYNQYQDFLKTYTPEPTVAPKSSLARSIIADPLVALASGVQQPIKEVGQAMDWVGEKTGITSLRNVGDGIRSFASDNQDYWKGNYSPEAKEALATPTFNDDNTFNKLTPRKYILSALESAPDMAAALIPGTAIVKGAKLLDVGRKVAGIAEVAGAGAKRAAALGTFAERGIAGGITEGLQAGLGNSADTYKQVMDADNTKIFALPNNQKILSEYGGDEVQAKKAIATQAANDVLYKTAASTGLIGLATGGAATGLLSEKLAAKSLAKEMGLPLVEKRLAGRAATGFAEEALQEGLQSPVEQVWQNKAERDYIDPSKKLSSGVVNSAAEGAVSGGLMGGVGGGLAHTSHVSTLSSKNTDPDTRLEIANQMSKSITDDAERFTFMDRVLPYISAKADIPTLTNKTERWLDLSQPAVDQQPDSGNTTDDNIPDFPQQSNGVAGATVLNDSGAGQPPPSGPMSKALVAGAKVSAIFDMQPNSAAVIADTPAASQYTSFAAQPFANAPEVQPVTPALPQPPSELENAMAWKNQQIRAGKIGFMQTHGMSDAAYAANILSVYRKSVSTSLNNQQEPAPSGAKGKANGITDTVPTLQNQTGVDGVAVSLPEVQANVSGYGSDISQPGGVRNGLSSVQQKINGAQEEVPGVRNPAVGRVSTPADVAVLTQEKNQLLNAEGGKGITAGLIFSSKTTARLKEINAAIKQHETSIATGQPIPSTPVKTRVTTDRPPNPARKLDSSADSLIVAVAKMGGVSRAEVDTQSGNGKDLAHTLNSLATKEAKAGILHVISSKGIPLDRMREALVEQGYLDESDGISTLLDRLDEASRGNHSYSSSNHQGGERNYTSAMQDQEDRYQAMINAMTDGEYDEFSRNQWLDEQAQELAEAGDIIDEYFDGLDNETMTAADWQEVENDFKEALDATEFNEGSAGEIEGQMQAPAAREAEGVSGVGEGDTGGEGKGEAGKEPVGAGLAPPAVDLGQAKPLTGKVSDTAKPDMQSWEMDFGMMGSYTFRPVNRAPVPEGGKLVSSAIHPFRFNITKRTAENFDIPRDYHAFRVSVIENKEGGRYSQVEYMGDNERVGGDNVDAHFNMLKTSALETRDFDRITRLAEKAYQNALGKDTGDLFSKTNPEEGTSATSGPSATPEKTKLEDFGEKLGGAKKDRQPSLDLELSDADIAGKTLSEIWPKKEVEAIEDAFIAAVATAARAEIPNKPQKGYKLDRWVKAVQTVRMLAKLVQTVTREKFMEKADEYRLEGFTAKVRLLEQLERSLWGRVGKVAEYKDAYRYDDDGKKVSHPWVDVQIDGRTQHFQANNVLNVLDQIQDKLGVAPAEKKMQFEVRGSGSSFKINKKGDSLYRSLKHFDTSKEALEFVKSNHTELVQAWEDLKDKDNVKERDLRKDENRPRTGADHRKGKDVTPDMILKDLGFRGIEFGNWVGQGKNEKERQGVLNAFYDAVFDLAAILGVPPKALSLNGTLGIGFGSRGTGWASAHYEPTNLVINMTKTRGAGSLAHELFHAIDRYFQMQRSPEWALAKEHNYVTYYPETYYQDNKTGHRFPEADFNKKVERKVIRNPENWTRIEGVRPEVAEAFDTLVKTLDASPMAERSSLIDAGKSGGYWSRVIERAARAFENYVIFKMQQQGYHNDYLANVTTAEEFRRDIGRYHYLLDTELEPVVEAFDNLFATIKTKETDKGVAIYSNPMLDPQAIVASLSGLKENLQQDLPKLVNLGHVVIHEGAQKFQQFIAGMKQYLGDKWDTFKGLMLKVYHQAKAAYKNSPLGNEIKPATIKIEPARAKLVPTTGHGEIAAPLPANFALAAPFYSHLEQIVEKKMGGRMPVADLVSMLKKNGVTDAEIDNVIGDIRDEGGVVTRQQVLDEIKANGTEFKDVALARGDFNRKAALDQILEETRDEIDDYNYGDGNYWYESIKQIKSEIAGTIESTKEVSENEEGEEEYSYTFEGKTKKFDGWGEATEDELLELFEIDDSEAYDRIPESERKEGINWALKNYERDGYQNIEEQIDEMERDAQQDIEDPTHFSQYTEPGAVDGSYREMFVTAPEGGDVYTSLSEDERKLYSTMSASDSRFKILHMRYMADKGERSTWQDGHSQYSDIQNPIVRIRFNERQVPSGKEAYVAGTDKGYGVFDSVTHDLVADYTGQQQARLKASQTAFNKILFVEEIQGPSDSQQKKMPEYLRKRIYDIGVKRVLAYAKENGFDGVAWTNGDMQASRYDLSKHVDNIGYQKRGENYNITVWDKAGKQVWQNQSATARDVEETLGKEILKKMENGEGNAPAPGKNLPTYLTGLDLKVGGEGLKSLYDKTLPALFKKYGKEAAGEISLTIAKDSSERGATGEYKVIQLGNGLWTVRDDVSGPPFIDGMPADKRFESKAEAMSFLADINGEAGVSVPYIPITDKTPAAYPQFKLSSTSTPSGIKASEVQQYVNTLKIAGHVVVRADVDHLPARALRAVETAGVSKQRVQAFELDGTIYLVSDNISDMERAHVLVMGHELAHAGQTAPLVKAAVNWFDLMLKRDTPAAHDAKQALEKKAESYGYDLSVREQYIAAVKEVTAETAEEFAAGRRQLPGLMARVLMHVKHWLRQNGFISHVSDSEIFSIVAEMLRIGEKRLSVGKDNNEAQFAIAAHNIESVLSQATAPGNIHAKADMGKVSDWLSAEAGKAGLDVAGFNHILDTSAVRHIKKEHGDAESELKRGQIGITDSDFQQIPDVVANPDKVVFGTKNKIGRDQIIYLKKLEDGTTLYFEEIRTGRKELAAVTIRKYPATMNADSILSTLDLNVQDDGGNNLIIADGPKVSNNNAHFALSPAVTSVIASAKETFGENFTEGMGKSIGQLLNPLDWSRGRKWFEAVAPDSVKAAMGGLFGTPLYQSERDANKLPFYEAGQKREEDKISIQLDLMGYDGTTKGTSLWGRVKDTYSNWQNPDKATAWGRILAANAALSGVEQRAVSALLVEGDRQSKVYSSLDKAMMNPRIASAKPTAAAFKVYKDVRHHMDTVVADARERILIEMFGKAGLSKAEVGEHVADYRKVLAERPGWLPRNHGEGSHQVNVYHIVDGLKFDVKSVTTEAHGDNSSQAYLPYYAGAKATAMLTDFVKQINKKYGEAEATREQRLKFGSFINGKVLMANGQMIVTGSKEDVAEFLKHAATVVPAVIEGNKQRLIDLQAERAEKEAEGASKAVLRELDKLIKSATDTRNKVKVFMQLHESQRRAEKALAGVRKDMKGSMPVNFRADAKYESDYKIADSISEATYGDIQGDFAMEQAQLHAITRAVQSGDISAEEAKKLRDNIIKSSAEVLLGRANGRHQIERVPYMIEGCETDNALQLYHDYMTATAGQISKAVYAHEQFENFRLAPPEVKAWAEKYIKSNLRNLGAADRAGGNARAVATFMYLGFKVSSILVNSTQTWTLGVAELGRRTKQNAFRAIGKAQKDIMAGKLSADEKDLFNSKIWKLQEMETAVNEMSGEHAGVSKINPGIVRGTLKKIGVYKLIPGLEQLNFAEQFHTLVSKSLMPFQEMELMNRRTMILAAYRSGLADGMNKGEAIAFALDVNSKTNFDMNRGNLPEWAQKNALFRTGYALQSFVLNNWNWIYNRATSGEKADMLALLKYAAMITLIAGPTALAGGDEADKLYRRIFGRSIKMDLQHWTRTHLKDYGFAGDRFNAFIWHGVAGASGINISNSMRLNIPMAGFVTGESSAGEAAMGIWSGLYDKGERAITYAARGQFGRALESAAPVAIGGPLTAYRMATEGATTRHGKMVPDENGRQVKYNAGEAVTRALGFQPMEQSQRAETAMSLGKINAHWNEKRQDMIDALRSGNANGRDQMLFNTELRKSQAFPKVGIIKAGTIQALKTVKPDKKSMQQQRAVQ